MSRPSPAAALLLAGALAFPPGLSATEASLAQATARIAQAAKAAGVAFPFASPEIRIFKGAHRLELWAGGREVKVYRVGLGSNGLEDKRVSGDHRTPEGRFYVCSRNSRSAFHLFLGISYPGEAAARRGLRDGLVSRREYEAILRASAAKACPPWNTRLGGTVGIHGSGSGSDWTWGCVALEDAEVDELWASCPLGTPILINP